MTTQTTDARIDARRASLMQQRAERLDPLDLPRSMTQREMNAYIEETATLDKNISAFNTAVEAWAALPTVDADTTWLGHLNEWRPTLCDELMTIKSPIRDKDTKQRADRLTFSIRLIDRGFGIATLPIVTLEPTPLGRLMAAAGYETQGEALRGPRGWRGSIKEVEARIKAITKQVATAQAALDPLLMDDAERAQADAESQAQRDALATMNIKNNTNGDGLVAETLYGDPLPVEAMAPEQRSAFERFQAVAFPPREVEVTESEAIETEATS